MEIKMNQEDVDYIGGAWGDSFAQKKPDRFEETTIKGVPFKELEDGKMFCWCNEYLNALITYNWYVSKGYRSAIMYDMDYDMEYVVWVDMTLKQWSKEKTNDA